MRRDEKDMVMVGKRVVLVVGFNPVAGNYSGTSTVEVAGVVAESQSPHHDNDDCDDGAGARATPADDVGTWWGCPLWDDHLIDDDDDAFVVVDSFDYSPRCRAKIPPKFVCSSLPSPSDRADDDDGGGAGAKNLAGDDTQEYLATACQCASRWR